MKLEKEILFQTIYKKKKIYKNLIKESRVSIKLHPLNILSFETKAFKG